MKAKRKLLIILIILSAVIFVMSAVQIITVIVQYNEAKAIYGEMQDKYVLPVTESDETEGEPETELRQAESTPSERAPIAIDFASLLQENSDVVGWLYCADTPINYPVVQADDNNYYLRKDLKRKYLISGTLFTDYRNGLHGTDRNYIIFGHNMKDATMFGTILKYKEQSYYDAHPVLYHLTPETDYKIEVYAGCVVSTDECIYQVNPDEEERAVFLKKAREKSGFQTDVTLEDTDTIVTLSTCSYEFDGARFVLIGKLVPLDR